MSYKAKRAIQGGDSYGTWREGRQVSPERINGHTLTYGLVRGVVMWRGSVHVTPDGKVVE